MISDSFKHLPLARLCKEHRAFADKTLLSESLGDGALYERNHVFRNIRDAAIAAGCRYTTEDQNGYFAWPLVQLPTLLATRVIPYRKTFIAVSALAAADAHLFTTAHAESLELQPNVVMHESAHCIADSFWQRFVGDKLNGAAELATLLRFTIAESFANATELAAMASCHSVEDRWFLSFNSYWSWHEEIANAWKTVAANLEPAAPARWVLACFISANLQKKRLIPELSFMHALTPQKYDAEVQAALRLLHSEAFNLNPVFRRDTFDMFFRSVGCDPEALLNMRVETAMKPSSDIAAVCELLVEHLLPPTPV